MVFNHIRLSNVHTNSDQFLSTLLVKHKFHVSTILATHLVIVYNKLSIRFNITVLFSFFFLGDEVQHRRGAAWKAGCIPAKFDVLMPKNMRKKSYRYTT